MAAPTLIYCADGNRRFAEIAVNAGFLYGARLPARGLPFAPWFADQDWKKPNRKRYMAELATHRPTMASMLDLETPEQLAEVLSWSEEAAQYVARVMIIPKAHGIIDKLPHRIGAADVVLGYSVPTRYGGTEVAVWEFAGWPVHLLGGSPHAQMSLAHYMNAVSADGNYHQLMASRYCEVWKNGRWYELNELRGYVATDAIYTAFEMSCENIVSAWSRLTRHQPDAAGSVQSDKQALPAARVMPSR